MIEILTNKILTNPILNNITTTTGNINTLQNVNDTIVYLNTTDTLTNKTFGTNTTFSSTEDANINTPTLGSIITDGGINVSKNICSKAI